MTLRKQVKYNAKRCLCNSWGKAVAISLMGVAIYLLFAIIEMIANLLLTLPAQTSYLIPGISDSWLLSFAISVVMACLLYTSPSPRDGLLSRMPSSA